MSFAPDEVSVAGSHNILLEKATTGDFDSRRSLLSMILRSFDSIMKLLSIILRIPARLSKCKGIIAVPLIFAKKARLLSTASPSITKTSGIPALDGLRGVACLVVFNNHFSNSYTDTFLFGYGMNGHRSIIQWPFIRVMWSGTAMVTIFFIISGYVLSHKPLRYIQDRTAPHVLYRTIASSTFRRLLRLYLPPAIIVLNCGFLASVGGFRLASAAEQAHPSPLLHGHERVPPQFDGFLLQMGDALKAVWSMFYFWRWAREGEAPYLNYGHHLWTIPVEFRCSMVLFLTLITTSHLRQKVRFAYVLLFMGYCVATERRDVLLFLCGMLIADLDLLYRETGTQYLLPSLNSHHPSQWNLRNVLSPALFILGLFLVGVPMYGEPPPGYRTLIASVSKLPSGGGFLDKPSALLECVGSVLIVWSVTIAPKIPFLTSLFMSVPAQYLGRILYALYLVHGTILTSLEFSIMPWIVGTTHIFSTQNEAGRIINGGTTTGFVMAWLIGLVVVLPVTILAADLFQRWFDKPCVAFSRRLEQICIAI